MWKRYHDLNMQPGILGGEKEEELDKILNENNIRLRS